MKARILDREFTDRMKKRLLKEKERLSKELFQIESEMHHKQTDESGENAYEDEMADVGTNTFLRERDDSLIWNIKDLLYQVDSSLERIKDHTYGQCVECTDGIPKKRLLALPWASTCLSCRKKREAS